MANEIFISYRRSDEPRARLFYNLLKERGVEAWYDAKIEAGEDWRTSTANALDAAPIFVLLMSKTASESGDIAKELAAATHKRKLVVPVRLDNMQLEGMFLYELASRNWIDAYHDTEKRLGELADKLAALVKADMSPEAAAQLDVNVAEIAAAKSSKGAFPRMMQKGGSVALITAGAVALLAAAGGGVWYFTKSSLDEPPKAWTNGASASAATATTAAATPAAAAAPATPKAAPTLIEAFNALTASVKAAGRSDAEVTALTDAAGKLATADAKRTQQGGDAAALDQIKTEMNDIALAGAKAEITALAADPVAVSVQSDFKSVVAEQKSSGVKMDAALAKTMEDVTAAQAAIKAANDAGASADAYAAVTAAQGAQQAIATLVALQPTASEAFLKAKRLSYASNSSAARSLAGQIAQFATAKKPSVFANTDRKEAYKLLLASDASARARMAEVDVNAGAVATADRKTVTKYAAQAATVRTELAGALVKAQQASAKLAAPN